MKLFEMAAKKICEKCGKSMSGNHYWYKGGWKCSDKMGSKPRKDKEAAAGKSEPEDTTPGGRGEIRDYVAKDANDAAATERAKKFRAELLKKQGRKDDDD